jgi:hypothetical protein
MTNTEAALLSEVSALRSNKVVMAFVTSEAHEKTAADIRAKTGSGTTAKAVEMLAMRREDVRNRIASYVAAGLVGVLMAKHAA